MVKSMTQVLTAINQMSELGKWFEQFSFFICKMNIVKLNKTMFIRYKIISNT